MLQRSEICTQRSAAEMSQAAQDLLIIYETEAKQWATYLESLFTGSMSEAGICCYDIATVSSRRDDFLRLSCYTCKLLILSKGMLESLCQMRRFFLARVLSPAAHVVVLLCGVDTLTPLLELVPLNGDECLQISSEQDAPEYLSIVTDIVRKGVSAPAANPNPSTHKPSGSEQKAERRHSTGTDSARSSIMVIPPRVPCGGSTEVFVLLRKEAAGCDTEVEFSGENQSLRLKPVRWNERILCVRAPDFPAGNVKVTVFSGGVPLNDSQLQYYSSMEEITCLLSRSADPVDFMCQALGVSSVDKLDQKLASMLLEGMPTGGFRGLQSENTPERAELHHADVPSLLHFAAQYGFRSVSSLLLQCPGADRALHTANCHGQTPTEIAKSHGHAELHILLKETLNMLNSGEDNSDSSVYEMMCKADVQKRQHSEDKEGEDEDLYAPLEMNDEYDTILNSTKAVLIANRPPAPTPRPESTEVKESGTPYIAQVFQKKTPQGDADLYSLPTKQARSREDRKTSTYDTFEPNQTHGVQQQLTEHRVKSGLLTADDAAEKAVNGRQQESHVRASIINNRADDDSVYDKINIVHQPPSVAVNESRRGSQAVESGFYSKPLKGQQSNFFRKADKR